MEYRDSNPIQQVHNYIQRDIYTKIIDVIPIVCVDVAIVRERKVFLTKRKFPPAKNCFWVQGGRLLKYESLEQAAIRKAAEELNLPEEVILLDQNLGTFSTIFNNSFQGPASHTVNITFVGHLHEEAVPGFDTNHTQGFWFPLDGRKPDDVAADFSHHPYIKNLLLLLNATI